MLDKQKLIANLSVQEEKENYKLEIRPTVKEEVPEEIWNKENFITFIIKIEDKRNRTEEKGGTLHVAGFSIDLTKEDIPEEVYAQDMKLKINKKIEDIMAIEPDSNKDEDLESE